MASPPRREAAPPRLPREVPKLGPGTLGLHPLVGSSCKETEHLVTLHELLEPGLPAAVAVSHCRQHTPRQPRAGSAARPVLRAPGQLGWGDPAAERVLASALFLPSSPGQPGKRCCTQDVARQGRRWELRSPSAPCQSLLWLKVCVLESRRQVPAWPEPHQRGRKCHE